MGIFMSIQHPDSVGKVRTILLFETIFHASVSDCTKLTLVRLSLLCFRKQRLVVYVYDDGLVLLEGAAWGQKSRRVIRWDQITKVHVDIEVRDRVFYKAGYYKQWPPIRDEIPHYTFQLQDGSLIKLPEDVSEVESLFARIEAMIASHRHK